MKFANHKSFLRIDCYRNEKENVVRIEGDQVHKFPELLRL